MSDLAQQILAAIGRVEDLALRTPPGPWHPNAENDQVLAVDDIVVCEGFALSNRQLRATVDHIVMHEPRSVGRRCAADREIVALHMRVSDGMGYHRDGSYGNFDAACSMCGMDDEYAVAWPCSTLHALARGYGIQP